MAQGRMVLTVLGIAGPKLLPSPRQLRAMRNCPGGCGDAKAFDSLLVSTERIWQGGNGQGLSEYRFLALMGYEYAAFHRLRIRIVLIS